MPRVGSSARRRARNASASNAVGEHVRAERGEPLVEARAALRHQLQHRPVELDDVVAARAEHEPGAARRAAPARAVAVDRPRARHAQVRVQHEIAFEAQEQVLAVRVDLRHRAAAQPLGPAVARVARLRREDLVRHGAFQHRPDALRRSQDRVALGHDSRVGRTG